MKRILLLCQHDWRSPAAGVRERYAFEVFSRVAGAGNYVVWICSNVPLLSPTRKRLPRVERAGGMLVAHLGSPLVYRFVAPLFFKRFTRSMAKSGGFDVCIDCIEGKPSVFIDDVDAPVLPIVFQLDSELRAAGDMPGPVIAATVRAEKQLQDAGISEDFLVRAPCAVASATSCPASGPDSECSAAVRSWDATAAKVLAVIESL